MFRLLIRFLGLLLLAGGFIALIVDGTRSLAGGRLLVASLRGAAEQFAPAAIKAIGESTHALWWGFIWDPVLLTLMHLPISVAFGGLGALFIIVSHRKLEE